MEWLIVVCLLISTINFYFLLKISLKKPFGEELEEFRTYTETLITEFNRITTRNVELLDSRTEELNHKIRLAQKVDLILKERFEEAHKIEFLKPLQLDQIPLQQTPHQDFGQDFDIKEDAQNNALSIEEIVQQNIQEYNLEQQIPIIEEQTILEENSDLTVFTMKEESFSEENTPLKNISPDSSPNLPKEELLFEGISIEKIKKHKKNSPSLKKKRELLIHYLQEKKSKEELLDLGFTSNEINIAYLYHINKEESEKKS